MAIQTIQSVSRQCDPATASKRMRLYCSSERSRGAFPVCLVWGSSVRGGHRWPQVLLLCLHVYNYNIKYTAVIKTAGCVVEIK